MDVNKVMDTEIESSNANKISDLSTLWQIKWENHWPNSQPQ